MSKQYNLNSRNLNKIQFMISIIGNESFLEPLTTSN